jgi:hypothetical protein
MTAALAAVAAAAAAVTVTALPAGSHPASPAASARLACSPLGFGPGLLGKIFPGRRSGVVHHLNGGLVLGTGGKAGGDMFIDPSAIPSGAGLQLAFSRMDGSTRAISAS